MSAAVVTIPCLSDNYAYLLTCTVTGKTAVIDPSEAEPVLSSAASHKLPIDAIWATHHHPDHVGGVIGVRSANPDVPVLGHVSDRGRIPEQTGFLEDGEAFTFGELSVRVLHIPGHTTGAVAYFVESKDGAPAALFTGDTLFLAGCGRLFEGTPAMMHASLQKLAALPQATRVYCGHEYTASNLRFAAHVEPENDDVKRRAAEVDAARAAGKVTVPGTLGEELLTNPFLRTASVELRKTLGVSADADAATALGQTRAAKDSFR